MNEDALTTSAQQLLRRPYRKVISGTPEDGFLAEAPELPGCFTAGDTEEEALGMLHDAMLAWFKTALADGMPIPETAAESAQRYSGQFRLRLPRSLHKTLADQAAAEGVSLNQLVLTYLAQGAGQAAAIHQQ
jgi:antitoxin HicB